MQKHTVMLVDLVLVVVFAAIGRASHNENIFSGLVTTAWPFLVACLVAWAILLFRRRPVATLGGGVFVWLVTAFGGLALRIASGTSAHWSFWIVATVALGILLLGWRAIFRKRLVAA